MIKRVKKVFKKLINTIYKNIKKSSFFIFKKYYPKIVHSKYFILVVTFFNFVFLKTLFYIKKIYKLCIKFLTKFFKLIYRFLPVFLKKYLKKFFEVLHRRFKKLFKPLRLIVFGGSGYLKWNTILWIGFKNVFNSGSKTLFTILAIGLGVGAMVFLVSFGYGLQAIVEQRLIKPKSLRLIDVQSDSTGLQLNSKALLNISKLNSVEDTAYSVTLAGSVEFNNSKTEVVVMGADNKFLDYSFVSLEKGKFFSDDAEKDFTDTSLILEKISTLLNKKMPEVQNVKGTYDVKFVPKINEKISDNKLTFRVLDYAYVPIRVSSQNNSTIIGYINGGITKTFEGVEVWGESYRSSDTRGKSYLAGSGDWFGKWLKIENTEYYVKENSGYTRAKSGEELLKIDVGYISEQDLYILTSAEVKQQNAVNNVLGTSDSVDKNKDETYKVSLDNPSTEDSTKSKQAVDALSKIVEENSTKEAEVAIPDVVFLEVLKDNGREIIVSTFLLNALNIKPNEAIGKNINISFILSNGVVPGISGKAVSDKNEYKIVGIYNEDEKPVVIVPISSLKSLGVDKYTVAKVLVKDTLSVESAREKIQAMGFSTQSVLDTLTQINKFFNFVRVLMAFLGLMALVVAIVGMVNTLTVSLLERSREIGVMKTLGTTDTDVNRLFLAESVILAFVGGVVGSLGGLIFGLTINLVTFVFRKNYISLFVTPLYLVILMIFVSVIIGLFTGLYPARRSNKITALEALRYE